MRFLLYSSRKVAALFKELSKFNAVINEKPDSFLDYRDFSINFEYLTAGFGLLTTKYFSV